MARHFFTAAAAAALLAFHAAPLAQTAAAQEFHRPAHIQLQQQGQFAIRPDARPGYVLEPRFVVEAMRIHARDETGPDWPGSDEIYLEYRDRAANTHIFTGQFGDFDTGETRTVPAGQSCVAPLGQTVNGTQGWPVSWSCAPAGAATVNFQISVWESDGWSPMACAGAPGAPPDPTNCDDDLVGRVTHRLTAGALAGLMPRVGDTHVRTARAGGYDVTYRVRRVADVQRPMTATTR